jgi:hypothetical protein
MFDQKRLFQIPEGEEAGDEFEEAEEPIRKTGSFSIRRDCFGCLMRKIGDEFEEVEEPSAESEAAISGAIAWIIRSQVITIYPGNCTAKWPGERGMPVSLAFKSHIDTFSIYFSVRFKSII